MQTKTITFELNGWEIKHLRDIINAIKDFNRTTDDKADIGFDVIRQLDGADHWLAQRIGMEQPKCEHGSRNWYADYVWTEEDDG